MRATFLLGPAGSGKTHRCLGEIRAELLAAPGGLPLVLIAPKQATFQLERRLLADPALAGYTRLQILSFERLAELVLAEFAAAPPRMLNEEGRVMVLRALLGQKQSELKMFRATARLPGFAQQLSLLLRELQRHQMRGPRLASLADQREFPPSLRDKLRDVALLLSAYLDWLNEHQLQDANGLLDLATEVLRAKDPRAGSAPAGRRRTSDDTAGRAVLPTQPGAVRFAGLWLDGFAEMTPQELDFLAALAPFCERATFAFCLENEPPADLSWLSTWSVVGGSFRGCQQRLAALPDCEAGIELLQRNTGRGRFAASPSLEHLERHWDNPLAFPGAARSPAPPAVSARGPTAQLELGFEPDRDGGGTGAPEGVRLVICANPEAEATFAARAIRRYIREEKGRYRDVALLLRSLEGYHDAVRRVLARYEIPFFLDRRESVSHHPLAELTRYALRTVAFGWEHDDWFGALKTGLVTADDDDLDCLENEALARGWKADAWTQPLRGGDEAGPGLRFERLRRQIVPPFQDLAQRLGVVAGPPARPTGGQLAGAMREFWTRLNVQETLEAWSDRDRTERGGLPSGLHSSVWEQLQSWLDNLDRAFANESLPLRDWLPIVEAGLGNLTAGVVPPALDQVLVGTVDRSRNPDLQLAFLLGANEGVFPTPPPPPILLNRADRETLAARGVALGPDPRQQIGLERYYAYIACTRARQQLVLTCARSDGRGRTLNPSPFLDHLRRLFPRLETEEFTGPTDWRDAEHRSELIAHVLQPAEPAPPAPERASLILAAVPLLNPVVRKWAEVTAANAVRRLSPRLAEKIYGTELNTSVSGLEDFASCPFKFFAGRGLRAEERVQFEVDDREKGSFQHEALKKFHLALAEAGRRWRDLSPAEARERIRRVGEQLLTLYRDGLFLADASRQFTARMLIEALENTLERLVGWAAQYQFEPTAVELGFGLRDSRLPPWRIDLDGAHALLLRGRIDRVDICRVDDRAEWLGVVIDYKSSARSLDPVLLHHGLELQLLGYLGALSHVGSLERELGVAQLQPAGGFYVNLKGGAGSAESRETEREGRDKARNLGYQHRGRFDGGRLELFDRRDVSRGDQFRYAKNKNGGLARRGNEALPSEEFRRLIGQVEDFLRQYGRAIYEGAAEVAPYRWRTETACDLCAFRPVCRFDPWTQSYRVLRPPGGGEEPGPAEENGEDQGEERHANQGAPAEQ